jgi:hypothetical protein
MRGSFQPVGLIRDGGQADHITGSVFTSVNVLMEGFTLMQDSIPLAHQLGHRFPLTGMKLRAGVPDGPAQELDSMLFHAVPSAP